MTAVDRKLLPRVLGEGGIFAYSGWDGETSARSEFVGTWGKERLSLLVHTPLRRKLFVPLREEAKLRFVTGDVCVFEDGESETKLVFTAWHTIIGESSAAEESGLVEEGGHADSVMCKDGFQISFDQAKGDAVVLHKAHNRFALAFGNSVEEACQRAHEGIRSDIDRAIESRLQIHALVPQLASTGRTELLHKCVSVMKVNTMAPEGAHKRYWSTPDRVPHKDMWLWDTVVHSLAMNKLSPSIAWECLANMLESQLDDGMLPHLVTVHGRRSSITQPPIMAWGVWQNYQYLKQKSLLEQALPRLEAYLQWNLNHRDSNGNGLLEWEIEGDVHCRSGESGMDNSSRFDEACKLDAVDFNVFMAQDMASTAAICLELGIADKALFWEKSAQAMERRILDTLWDNEDGFFYDRKFDRTFSKVKAVSGFLPLLLDGIREEQIDRLVDLMKDKRHFDTKYPLPSIAISDPTWSTDMWRGPVWINLNYLIILGLRKHQRHEEADFLQERTVELVHTYYERYGVTFEYYDSKDELPPVACDRKGPRRMPYDIRNKYDAIRDYHWTAALTACLIWPDSQ